MASEESSGETNGMCVSCEDVEVSSPAKIYCIECEESVCERCSNIRHRTKMMQGHSMFDLHQQEKDGEKDGGQNKFVQIIGELLKCSKHPDKAISCLCKDDNSLCCTDCIMENHRHCDAIVDIQSETFKSENESTVKKAKERFEEIVVKIDTLVVTRNDTITEVKRKVATITNEVKEIRTKINNLLDALEENIASKAKAISKKYAMEVEDENTKLKGISKPLKDHISVIANALSICSGGQTYIMSRKLEQKIVESENRLFEVCSNFKKYEIGLKITSFLQSWLDLSTNDTDVLAEVTEEVQKMPVPGIMQREVQFSHTGVERVTEYDILPQNPPHFQPEYYGMIYTRGTLATRRMLLVSTYGSFFCVVDNNYNATECFNKECLTGEPYGLTELKHNVIAVGLPKEKKIVFLSENQKSKCLELFGHVDTRNKPKALCGLSNGDLAVSFIEPVGFGILNFKYSLYACRFEEKIYFTEDKSGRTLKTFDFMAVDEKRLNVIQPCTTDKALYCFDFDGNPKFKYTHEDLAFPRGVGISGDGNIFVCDQETSVIHGISPYGQGLRVVREGCPEKPLAIAFDPSGLQFAVSQNKDPWIKVKFFRLTGR